MGKKNISKEQETPAEEFQRASKNIIHPKSHAIEQGRTLEERNPSKGEENTPKPPKRVSKSDDFVWDLPGFDKYEFYAAADYLRRHEKNQGLPRPANNTQAPTNIRTGLVTGKLEQKMLDYLALLFAKAKRTDIPAKHVTATALRKVGTGFEIWIAKNEGPKDEDEEFRSNLELWFKRKGDWEKDAALMTSEIKHFWRDRLDHYADKIRILWTHICEGPKPDTEEDSSAKAHKGRRKLKDVKNNSDQFDKEPIGLVKSYNTLTEIYRNEMADLQLFERDWNEAKSLCSNPKISQQQLKSADETVLPSGIERQSYETFDLKQPQSHLEVARGFCKLLKAIRLLGTVAKAIQILTEFRENLVQNRHVKLRFLDAIESLDLEPEACTTIAETMNRWTGSKSNQKFKKEIQERAEALQAQSKFHRYFHCELQMLDMFLDDAKAYDYFGCSKLSCFICWGVLQGTPFRTRATHANLWAACAFPFSMERGEGNSRYQLLLALKKVQDHLVEKVLRRALDPEFNFSDNLSLAETEPGGELGHRRKTRTFWRSVPGNLSVQGNLPVQFVSTRSIWIPVEGKPVSKIVEFRVKHWSEMTIEGGIAPSIWMDPRSTASISSRQISEEVYSEQRGSNRIGIQICAQRHASRNSENQNSTAIVKVNNWFRDLIQAFHKYSYDPTDTTCVWRGDLYIFRTINRYGGSAYMVRDAELDTIEREETMEVVQKCRDALAEGWVCSSPTSPT